MHVQLVGGVHPRLGLAEDVHAVLGVQLLERPERSQIEDRSQVHVEPLGALAREDPDAAREGVHRAGRQRGVPRGGQRPDVARGAGETAAHRLGDAACDPGDGVELPAVPVRAVQRPDRAGVVEERVRVPQPGGELELIGDVRLPVPVGVDVDLVEDVVTELVEVRAARGLLERDVVGDQRDRRWPVRADERVDVRAVRDRVLGDLRRLAVR